MGCLLSVLTCAPATRQSTRRRGTGEPPGPQTVSSRTSGEEQSWRAEILLGHANLRRSYWIPGSYAPALSEKCNSFLMLLKNKGFKEERMAKVELYAIDKSTTLESNKSVPGLAGGLCEGG
jgi:hypothetical protein